MSLRAVCKTLLFLTMPISGTAFAGPSEDEARLHFKAIAGGDVDQIMRDYGQEATLQWVGGPLDGVYVGNDNLRGVWSKFAKSQGKFEHSVNNLQENTNPKGATVTANVEFSGKNTIKVRYVLTYRDSKLVSEVWQIDPNLSSVYSAGY
jgi:hypothetical protein